MNDLLAIKDVSYKKNQKQVLQDVNLKNLLKSNQQ